MQRQPALRRQTGLHFGKEGSAANSGVELCAADESWPLAPAELQRVFLSKAAMLQRQEVWSRLPQHRGWGSKAQTLRCSLSAPGLWFALGSHFPHQKCFSLPHYFTGKGQKYHFSKHHEDYINAVALAEKSVWTE